MPQFSITLLLLILASFQAWADEKPVPNIEEIRQKAEAEPKNLDLWFVLAEQSAKSGKFDDAAKAYEHMLEADPNLLRVKLDLSLVYSNMGRDDEAIKLLNEVKAANPPEEVSANIEKVLKSFEDKQKKGGLKLNAIVGYNYDTNANSASGNGQVLFNDINIPLDDASRAANDHQFISAAVVGYEMELPDIADSKVKTKWMSSATAYQTTQQDLTALNMRLFSGTSGFEFTIPDFDSVVKTQGAYSYIILDGHNYLNTPTASLNITTKLSDKISITEGATVEWRRFEDGSKDRTGIAAQGNVGLNYQFTEQDMANFGILFRKEYAGQTYYDNKQYGFNTAWTHILDEATFANLGAGLKWSNYGGADAFVSPSTIRHDKEKSMNFTVGHKILDDVTGTVGYQYRNVQSNVINYEYNNHRGMASVSWEY
jgi:tetratricopeptide (TPR) repeat protein